MQSPVAYEISVHFGHHNKTENFQIVEASQPWKVVEYTVKLLAMHIKAGKAFMCGISTNGRRREEDVTHARLIAIDIDGDFPLADFLNIPFIKKHALLIYTSHSHQTGKSLKSDHNCDDRYRAVFDIGVNICDRSVYRYIHEAIASHLGFEMSDHSGQHPERIWYGSERAEITENPDAEKLPWDLIEQAKDEAAKETERRAKQREASLNLAINDNDIARADWLLRYHLPPSRHGGGALGYEKYWYRVLVAIAQHYDALEDAFLSWHEQGEHTEERLNRRRIDRIYKGELANLFGIATDLDAMGLTPGPWQNLCPIKNSFNAVGTTLGSAFVLEDSSGGTVTAISKAKLEQYRIGAPREGGEPENGIDPILYALYRLRAFRERIVDHKLVHCPVDEYRREEDKLLKVLFESQLYARDPGRLDMTLLEMLCYELGINPRIEPTVKLRSFFDTDEDDEELDFIIPNWLLQGADHIIYGKGGSGKTQFALHLTRAALGDPSLDYFADAGPFNNHEHWDNGQAMFIQTDMMTVAKKNTRSMLKALGMQANRALCERIKFWYMDIGEGLAAFHLTLWGMVQLDLRLREAAEAGKPYTLMIIDSLKGVCPDDLRVGEQRFLHYYRSVNRLAHKYGVTLIWIHHSDEDGRMQGIKRIAEESSAEILLEKDSDSSTVNANIKKLRGQGIARKIKLDFMSKPLVTVIDQSDDDEDDADDLTDFLISRVHQHFNDYRQLHPNVSYRTLHANYVGLKTSELENEVTRAGLKASRRTIQTRLTELHSARRLLRRGHGRSQCYVPTLDGPGPITDELDF